MAISPHCVKGPTWPASIKAVLRCGIRRRQERAGGDKDEKRKDTQHIQGSDGLHRRDSVVMVHWSYTDIACVNSMNKAVVIKIVEICCCSLQKEGWLLSFGLRFSLRLESLTEHKGKAVKTQERVWGREGWKERNKGEGDVGWCIGLLSFNLVGGSHCKETEQGWTYYK